jgi:signal peptidase I
MWLFQLSVLRALQAWLPTLLASAASVALVFVVLRPFLFEAYVAPTNSMAPTLLGSHHRGVCPQCGQPNFRTPVNDPFGMRETPRSICKHFHVARISEVDPRVLSGDRFLVAKFFAPRRWDLVAFRFPENPRQVYVKRLVGLPGEKIQIDEGAAWANGQRLSPPESLRGIEYVSELPDPHLPMWGTVERPADLGQDEYFVLGDFSLQSRDSRFWERGAAGHNPFAVPESHLVGVVTHIYWPPGRWRILR